MHKSALVHMSWPDVHSNKKIVPAILTSIFTRFNILMCINLMCLARLVSMLSGELCDIASVLPWTGYHGQVGESERTTLKHFNGLPPSLIPSTSKIPQCCLIDSN